MKINKKFEYSYKIPDNLIIEKKDNIIFFEGPLGSTKLNLKRLDPTGIGAIFFENIPNTKNGKKIIFSTYCKSFFGLFTTIFKNKIYGLTVGYLIYLKIIGIGYRANIKEQIISLKLGFSHDISFIVPKSIRVLLLEPTLICLYAVDKNQVTQIAAKIKQLRPPSIYKGKGIRLMNERVQLKQGKRK